MIQAIKSILKIHNVTKHAENEQVFKENGFSLDFLGRPYHNFPVPNEFWVDKETLNGYVYKKINDTYFLFNRFMLDDYIHPVIFLDYKDQTALVVYSADLTSIVKWYRRIKYLVVLGLIAFLSWYFFF